MQSFTGRATSTSGQTLDPAPRGDFWDEAIETLPRRQLALLQLERLRWQLERCYHRSALYRSKLRQAGVDPPDVTSISALADVPVVTKEELRQDQAEHPPFGSFAVADPNCFRELHPSSGTTGLAVKTIWSARDVDVIADFTARTLWQSGARPGDVIQNAFAYGLWVAGLSTHYAAGRVGAFVLPLGTGVSTQKQIDYLVGVRSTVLLSTPSYALYISEELERQGIGPDELGLRIGCFGGEAGAENPSTRAVIERRLGIDAYDYYGLAEIGPTFASECTAKAGLHFAEDHVLVECLDPDSAQPVPDGELGVLVFTHLTKEATPMLRYWSSDYARLTRERCECGRTHLRAVGGILGRQDDLIVFKGAKFYPSQIEKVVRSFTALSPEFRIEIAREEGGSRIRSCTVVAEWAHAPVVDVEPHLLRDLRVELGVTPALRIAPAGTLERTAFKAVRVVAL